MRNSIKGPVAVACLLVAVAGCGQTAGTGTQTSVSASVSVGTAIETVPDAPVAPSAVPVAPAQQWAMPDLVGRNLQQAQDEMQKLTGNPVFITRSHDATGKKRNQVVDSNWQVCTQNVAPGGQVTGDSTVDFGAVKAGESCP